MRADSLRLRAREPERDGRRYSINLLWSCIFIAAFISLSAFFVIFNSARLPRFDEMA